MRLTSLLVILGIAFGSSAPAAILAASATPSTVTTNITAAAPVAITWRASRNGAPGTVTLASSQINFLINNTVVASTAKSLSKTIDAVNNVDFAFFSEVVIIPRNVLTQAAQTGQSLTIERDFEEVNLAGTQTASVTVAPVGGLGGELAINQVDLIFDDGSTSCISSTGDEHTAIARIRSTGSGLLRGSWQVREGGAPGGYHTLRMIEAPVSASGLTILHSPNLPTTHSNQRLDVRLMIDSPAVSFIPPEITCNISGPDVPPHTGESLLLEPQGKTLLDAHTTLHWKADSKAKAYRIDILSDEQSTPLASQMVKGNQTSAHLSPLTLNKLVSTQYYIVHVYAE